MIAVIADDFTGAAEIGGLGLRCKLKVEIEAGIKPAARTKADLLIISADTRSRDVRDAVTDIESITTALIKLAPSMIYKKVDSVLRGHIVAELAVQMKISGKKKALVIPANPALGRIIKNGIYYFDDRPLHKTGFKYDPDFTMPSSRVTDILRTEDGIGVTVATLNDTLPAEGIIVGEALDQGDFRGWLKSQDDDYLLAGAADFFLAILERQGFPQVAREGIRGTPGFEGKMLLACGSSFPASKDVVVKAHALGAPVSLMPVELTGMVGSGAGYYLDQWASDVAALFRNNDRVIVSCGVLGDYRDKNLAMRIRLNLAGVIGKIMRQTAVNELMLEGGSTASAVLNELKIDRVYPEEELAHGVIRMSISGNDKLHVTVKPGSYPWPSSVWNFAVKKY